MVRFLHTADWQIGMTRHFLQGEAQARFAAARIDAIRRLGVVAQQEECEFVIVCGDVFETNQLSRQTVGRALEALATIPVPVYLLPGNHDPLDPVTIYRTPQFVRDCPSQVQVLTDSAPVTVRDGVQLIPAPWFGKHPDHDLVGAALDAALGGMPAAAAADDVSGGPVRIVVGHGAVDVLDPDRTSQASIVLAPLERELAAGRLHYVALGDRHSRTSVGETGAVWYSGAIDVTSHREESPGDVLVVDVAPGRAPVVVPHHVGTWVFRTLQWELTASSDVAALAHQLAATPDKDRTVIRLALRGVLGVADHAELTDLLEEQAEVFAALYLWERHTTLRVVADDAELQDFGLGGFLGAAAEEMRAIARAPELDTVTLLGGEELDEDDLDAADLELDGDDALAELLDWEFMPDGEPDAKSSVDALQLLYRLSREVAR
ncbi:MAG TPA: metallophosphoesterase [Ornithinicoccus sp.]|nr:metallophosphoesterase [Ornithinicoccus sp.]